MISPIGKMRRNDGFLLLELMISISILSAGIILILNSFIGMMRAMETSQNYFKTSLALEEKMFRLYFENIDGPEFYREIMLNDKPEI